MSARRQTAARSRVRRMRDRDRAVRRQQQLRHRLADDVGAAEDDGLGAGERRRSRAAGSCSRAACRAPAPRPGRQPAGVDDVEAVDVLRRVDRRDHRLPRRSASAAAAARGCRRPPDRRSAARRARAARPARSRPAACARSTACRPRASPRPCCARRPRSRDPRPPERRRGPDRVAAAARREPHRQHDAVGRGDDRRRQAHTSAGTRSYRIRSRRK
jgi:hypothetical protein